MAAGAGLITDSRSFEVSDRVGLPALDLVELEYEDVEDFWRAAIGAIGGCSRKAQALLLQYCPVSHKKAGA